MSAGEGLPVLQREQQRVPCMTCAQPAGGTGKKPIECSREKEGVCSRSGEQRLGGREAGKDSGLHPE